jgi:hypothetical protein
MADHEDIRRAASKLPGAVMGPDGINFAVLIKGKPKGFIWLWNERIHPKKARVPNPDVLAVRVPDLDTKEMLLASSATKFFTEPHYNNYPAVLVRIEAIEADELEELIIDAWRCKAPKDLLEQYDKV